MAGKKAISSKMVELIRKDIELKKKKKTKKGKKNGK